MSVFFYVPQRRDSVGYAGASDSVVLLAGGDTHNDVLFQAQQLLDTDTVTAEAMLELLEDPARCAHFALIEVTDRISRQVLVTMRGSVRIDLTQAESSSLSWPPGSTWVVAEAHGVRDLSASLESAAADSVRLPLARGAVRAGGIAVNLAPQPAFSLTNTFLHDGNGAVLSSVDTVHVTAREEDSVEFTPIDLFSVKRADELDPGVEVAIAPSTSPYLSGGALALPRATPRASQQPHQSVSDPASTQATPAVADAPVGTAAATPAQASDANNPAPHVAAFEIYESNAQTPGLAGAPGHPSSVWTLKLPDGNEIEAASSIVVGRRPWRSDPDNTTTYYLVAPSPAREISGKHLEITVTDGALVARDLNSTNGTLVTPVGKAPQLLTGGASMTLSGGDVLDLGEGFSIVVGERI